MTGLPASSPDDATEGREARMRAAGSGHGRPPGGRSSTRSARDARSAVAALLDLDSVIGGAFGGERTAPTSTVAGDVRVLLVRLGESAVTGVRPRGDARPVRRALLGLRARARASRDWNRPTSSAIDWRPPASKSATKATLDLAVEGSAPTLTGRVADGRVATARSPAPIVRCPAKSDVMPSCSHWISVLARHGLALSPAVDDPADHRVEPCLLDMDKGGDCRSAPWNS